MAVKIDLITHDPNSDEFIFILVEDGPWPTTETEWNGCLSRIQDRIYDAIDVAVDGHLAAKYPESKNKSVRIQIDSPHGMPANLKELIAKLRMHLADASNSYNTAIIESPYIKKLSLSMGHERNPFN